MRAKVENLKSRIQDLLPRGLRTQVVGSRIVMRTRVSSTMDLAHEYVARGYPEGTVIFALEQTAGRGRFGARWWSPPGASLLFSVALWPRRVHLTPAILTLLGAVSVADVLRRVFNLDARIRWPNDVVVSGRKIAGVLVEARPTRRLSTLTILGIGLNLSIRKEDLPPDLAQTATSILIEHGAAPDPLIAARALLRSLDRWYARLHTHGTEALIQKWSRLSSTLAKRVLLDEKGKRYRGLVARITPAGQLMVKLDNGPERLFSPERTKLLEESDSSPHTVVP